MYEPRSHERQYDDPWVEEYLPVEQKLQYDCPALSWNEPRGQRAQEEEALRAVNVPGKHATHSMFEYDWLE